MNKTQFGTKTRGLRPSRYNSRKLDLVKAIEPYMKQGNPFKHLLSCKCISCYTPKV